MQKLCFVLWMQYEKSQKINNIPANILGLLQIMVQLLGFTRLLWKSGIERCTRKFLHRWFLLNWRVVQSGHKAINSKAESIQSCLIVIQYTQRKVVCCAESGLNRQHLYYISESRVQRADNNHNLDIFNEYYSHTKVVCWNVWVPRLSQLSLMHCLSDRHYFPIQLQYSRHPIIITKPVCLFW